MKIVQIDTRPARLALVLSKGATPRVARRGFRLLGGRWGGVNDLLLCIDSEDGPSELDLALLRAADPDYLISIDPELDDLKWDDIFRQADIQPFAYVRLRERMETRPPWSQHFVEGPTVRETEEAGAPLIDLDRPGLSWIAAAVAGLPFSHSKTERVTNEGPPKDAQYPVVRGRAGLTALYGGVGWVVIGDVNSLAVAANLWSLRALGARPSWHAESVLDGKLPPREGESLVLHAPESETEAVQKALTQWAKAGRKLHWSRQAPHLHVPAGRAHFGSALQAIPDDGDQLLFSTPTPPVMDGRIRRDLTGVVEVLVRSIDAESPDGIILTRNDASRRLLTSGTAISSRDRVTRAGIAGVQRIEKTELMGIPRITYEDAVAAPLIEAGYQLAPSDKGRYQQRSLQLARGLRYLAACFKNRERARLLDLFFEHHLGKTGTESYRRAVTYDDLRKRLQEVLRERRKRLPRRLLDEADTWLLKWTDSLLERGLLVGGYVLTCSHCAHRAWYRLDDLKQQHACDRCVAHTHIPANAIRSFHLNEAFYQLRLNNGEVVTLLLATLRESARESLLYLPEVSLSHPNAQDGEADAVALVDGDLFLAEAKSNNSVSKKEIAWYRYVGKKTGARQLIFATTDRSKPLCAKLECARCAQEQGPNHRDYAWNDGTRSRIEKAREESLADTGVRVETFCHQSLVTQGTASDDELVEL